MPTFDWYRVISNFAIAKVGDSFVRHQTGDPEAFASGQVMLGSIRSRVTNRPWRWYEGDENQLFYGDADALLTELLAAGVVQPVGVDSLCYETLVTLPSMALNSKDGQEGYHLWQPDGTPGDLYVGPHPLVSKWPSAWESGKLLVYRSKGPGLGADLFLSFYHHELDHVAPEWPYGPSHHRYRLDDLLTQELVTAL